MGFVVAAHPAMVISISVIVLAMFLVPDSFVRFFHRMASPPHFYALTERLMPWLTALFILLAGAGLYGGLYLAPPDYQQGDSYRGYPTMATSTEFLTKFEPVAGEPWKLREGRLFERPFEIVLGAAAAKGSASSARTTMRRSPSGRNARWG